MKKLNLDELSVVNGGGCSVTIEYSGGKPGASLTCDTDTIKKGAKKAYNWVKSKVDSHNARVEKSREGKELTRRGWR